MEKKESSKAENMKGPNIDKKNLRTSSNPKKQKNVSLPWWVEILFVQIGLPDKLLIKILKSKKKSKELIKNDKKFLFSLFFFLAILVYLYPIVKYSKSRLECESAAKTYIKQNKSLEKITRRNLKMLSTNFCNGGEEIYQIKGRIIK